VKERGRPFWRRRNQLQKRQVMAEPQEVPEGATDEETIGTTEDRSRDLHLAMGCRRQLKTRTKHSGGSRQECAAAVGLPTHCTVPAMRKGHVRRGPGKKCHSGIWGQNKVSRNGKSRRIVKWDRHLEGNRTHREVVRQSLRLEIAKLLVKSSIPLREPGGRVTVEMWAPAEAEEVTP
jgi:hypothetical protein